MISCLEAMFATHGLLLSIKTDIGPQSVSEEFEAYLKDQTTTMTTEHQPHYGHKPMVR